MSIKERANVRPWDATYPEEFKSAEEKLKFLESLLIRYLAAVKSAKIVQEEGKKSKVVLGREDKNGELLLLDKHHGVYDEIGILNSFMGQAEELLK